MTYFRTLVLLLYLVPVISVGQNTEVSGKVVDAINNLPLPGAVVMLDSTHAVITDLNGNFSIAALSGDQLSVSFLGYQTKNVTVGSNDLVVSMQPDNLTLENVVISGYENRYSAQNTAASVGVLGLKELRRDNNTLIMPAISRIPGVLMQSGAFNTNRLTIRGIGARTPFGTSKIRAYVNNIPLTTGDGSTTIEDLDLDLLQRVEVLKGPTSSIYGAGLGGTVVLDGSSPRTDNTRVSTEVLGGSFGMIKSNTTAQISEDGLSLGVTYNYLHSDGYRENNRYDRSSFAASGSLTKKKTTISFFTNFLDLKSFIPSSIDSATFITNPRAAAANWASTEGFEDYRKGLFGVSARHNFTDHFVADVSFFQSTYNSYELRPFNILTEKTQALGSRGVFQFIDVSKVVSGLNFGYEFFNDNYDWQTFENDNRQTGSILSNNQENRDYLNLFAQLTLQITSKLRLDAGVNFNTTNYRLDDRFNPDSLNQSGDYAFDNILSPRLSFLYAVGGDKNLYASISHGFSPPSLAETLTPDGLINPDIQPEQGYNYELGFKGDLLEGLYLDASLYTMQIRDLLVAERITADQFIGKNAGRTSHSGLEVYSRYIFRSGSLTMTPFINYTYAHYRFTEFIDDENDYSGNELTGVPAHQADLGIEWSLYSGVYGSLNYTFVGAMPMRDDNSIYSDEYGVTNLKVGWLSNLGNFNLDIYGGIQNLFDVKYASMILVNAPSFGGRPPRYYYPGLPVNYYAGVSASYSFK